MPLGRVRVLEDRTLRLERVTLADQGVYTCDADNFAGAVTASAHLTVLAPPTFSVRPSAQTVEVGQQVSFRCKSEGSPTPFLYWAIEGVRVLLYPGSNEGGFEVTDFDGVSTLILKEAQIQNSGTVVICSALNSAGSVSTRTRLTVTSKEDRPPPVIVMGPVNQTLPIGSAALITCKAEGNPAPFISWYKGGVPVSSSTRLNMTIPTHLTITDLQEEDSGSYTCVASSRFGKAVWTGHLTVADPKNPNINFFKAPEPSILPEAPGRPHALNQSEGSVTITWDINKKSRSSGFSDYQVELFGREENVTPTWTVVGRHIPGPTFTQHLLSTGVPYTFLVRARNEHGLGPPSQLSEPIVVGPDSTQNWGNPEVTILSEARAVLMTSNVVRLTEGIALSSTSIKVSWMVTDSTYVEGLYIYYISLNSDSTSPKGYSMLTVLHTGGSSSFTVNNLEKWSSYQFFLVPFFKNVEGYPSNSKTIKTLEDVPSEPPSYMEALLLNSTTVFLKWRPPEHSINGELQGYKVDVRTNGTDIVKSMSVGKAPNLLLNNLTAGVSYFVKVAAFTKAGTGPYNAEATLRLEPASRIADNTRRPLDHNPSGDFITETWFMALLVSMVSVMVLLFAAMMLVRRRQLANGKKSLTSRTNGHVLKGDCPVSQPPPLWLDKSTVPEYTVTATDRDTPLPDYAKACAGIRNHSKGLSNGSVPEYHGSINLQTNPLYKEFSRPDSLHYSSEKYYPITRKYKDYSCLQVQEYASPNIQPEKTIGDYAEVNNSGIHGRANGGNTSPAPYATTTLVSGKKSPWMNFAQSTSAGAEEDPPYPSLNGGYYNRKVYSDSYFSPSHTLRRPKRDKGRNNHQSEPLSPTSTNGSVYARVGPPGGATSGSWNGTAPTMSSFAPNFPPPPAPLSIYQGARSEPGNVL
ncbi:unnamed protein product [Acanthoscelides obtectus]|nr:unnamed protein product [Acanthoscelides obtectus]CAK1675239.1 Roundabout homolog 1 [Acanthoscelides obtectus]